MNWLTTAARAQRAEDEAREASGRLEAYLESASPRSLFWDGFWPEARRAGVSHGTAAAWCAANRARIDACATVMDCVALTHTALAEIAATVKKEAA